jgi:hypothetical protein
VGRDGLLAGLELELAVPFVGSGSFPGPALVWALYLDLAPKSFLPFLDGELNVVES